MLQKSADKNLSNPKTLQFHQIGNDQSQQSESLSSNQRVLILSTPIKLKDGTIGMEQRTIPLRIDNSLSTTTSMRNKNKIVSLKRSIEPTPVALPINQLNKESPTFVKNEIGQVMGKLIPLGKFSNVTQNTLAPMSTTPSASVTSIMGIEHFKHNGLKKTRKNKFIKLEKEIEKIQESNETTNPNSTSETTDNITPIISSATDIKSIHIRDQLLTLDTKPKKQVLLILQGYKNIASIGQTGTKIKLIPLDHWKLDAKSNLLKTELSRSMISHPKIVDVRSCAMDEINALEGPHFVGSKLNCSYGKADFEIDNSMEKDPLDIHGMLSEETMALVHPLAKSSSMNDVDLREELKFANQNLVIHKPDFIKTISESGRVDSSKILTLAKGGMNVQLKFDRKLKTQSIWPKKSNSLLKNPNIDSKSSKGAIAEDVEKRNAVTNNLADDVQQETETHKIDANYDELCKRFGIKKVNITPTETVMLAYICDLKKKLLQNQKNRVQELTALQPTEYLCNNNLSNIQKRFVESQFRNSGKMKKKHRFMKPDLVMARDILKATGPRGYSNLRKLFSLPDMGAVVKGISKT